VESLGDRLSIRVKSRRRFPLLHLFRKSLALNAPHVHLLVVGPSTIRSEWAERREAFYFGATQRKKVASLKMK